jgi:toxoflavin biosynthesis protein ToxC
MMIQHTSPISGVACSPHGYVATVGYDNQVILWSHRQPIARAWHDHLANQCDFSNDGSLLVTASSDYTARIWKIPELRLHSVLGDHQDDVEMAVFSPDGMRVATASRDHCLRIFDISGCLLRRFVGHEADVISVTWSVDGKQLVSSSDDGTVRRWSVETGDTIEFVDMNGIETDTVVICPNGAILAGTDCGEIHLLMAGRRQVISAHSAGIKRLALSTDSSFLVSASYDRTLRIWQIEAEQLILRYQTEAPDQAWVRSVAFDRSNNLVIGTFGSSYAIFCPEQSRWDIQGINKTNGINAVCSVRGAIYTVGDSGEVRCDGEIIQPVGSLCNFLIEWQGSLFTGGHLGHLIDARTGQVLLTHRSPLNCATVLPDGDVLGDLIIGTYTGEGLRIGRDSTTGSVALRQTIPLHDQAIKGIAANQRYLFSISADGSGAYHDVPTGQLIKRLPLAHSKIANGVCTLPDGRFASVSRDLHLRLWHHDQAKVIPSPHTRSIKCIALSREGRWLGTGSYNGMIAFYDLERSSWASSHRPTFAGISSLSACNENDCLLASSYDGKVYWVRP